MRIELYNDDCKSIFPKIQSESVDCVITDCPYHIVSGGCPNEAVSFGKYTEMGGVLSKRKKDSHGNTYVNDTKHLNLGSIFNEFDPPTFVKQGKLFKHNDIEFFEWLPEVYRVLKPDTHCYVMINARNVKELQEAAEEAGFTFQNLIVWDKGNSTPNKYYMNAYELILMLRKGKAKNINNMGTANILRVPNIVRTKKHPTEKPSELMQILVENSTNKDDLVLDPFMGVGGVGIACKNTDRRFIGIEIDEKYYNIAEQRINGKEHVEEVQMSIFDFIKV